MEEVRKMAQRIVNAEQAFVETIQGFVPMLTDGEARQVLNVYRRDRLVTLDVGIGRYHVKHGRLFDADVIRRAANACVRYTRAELLRRA